MSAGTAMARGGNTFGVSRALAGRSLRSITRQPSAFVPSLLFPIFQTIAFSGAFGAITGLPFFPTRNALSWFVPLAAIQGAGFAGMFTAFGVVRDFEDGFVDRLLLAPTRRHTLLYGPLLAALARAFVPVALVLAVGALGGVEVPGGVLGLAMLLLACLGVSVTAACWALGLAYRFQSMQAAPLMQIGLFFAIFMSTSQMPLEGLSGWLKTVARVNPMTYVLGMGRSGFIGQVTWEAVWKGLVALAVLLALTSTFATRGLRKIVR
ncbi:MAG TPA: ABC transporter permease [Acidimicrobiales bacterium]